MQHIASVLIFGYIVLAVITFYFGTHIRGRIIFLNVLYGLCLIYCISVGVFFLKSVPDEVLGGSVATPALNMSIYYLAIVGLQYIGWSRINRSRPWLHLLYLATITGLPLFTYIFTIQNKEAMAALSSVVCFFGLIRYCERRRGLFTFIILAAGMVGNILSKPSSATICCIMLFIILVSTIIKERNLKTALPKEFFFTLPAYVCAFIFAPDNKMVRTMELLNPEVQKHMAISILAFEILWCMPILFIIPTVRKFAKDLSLLVVAGWMAICIAFIYQTSPGIELEMVTVHFGLFIAMHYVPFIGIFGLAAAFVAEGLIAENGFDPDTEVTTIPGDIKTYSRRLLYNHLIYFLVLGFAFVLFFGNFPFFLVMAG